MEINFVTGRDSQLWADPNLGVYLLHGEEDILKQLALRALIGRFIAADFADFDLEVLSADTSSIDAIMAAVTQVPFASDRRVVVVRDVEKFRDRNRAPEAERLADAIPRLSPPACLILVVGADDDDNRRKTVLTTRIDAAIGEFGALVSCRTVKGEALSEWINEQFHTVGKRIAPEAVELLLARAGCEMRGLEMEIFKLIQYLGPRHHASCEDVSAVTATQSEDVMFQCVDAISRKQTDRALVLLSELHHHDPKPQAVAGRLLALLVRQFRLMWQAKHLAAVGITARDIRSLRADIAAELPGENSIVQLAFKASELFAGAARYSEVELRNDMEAILLCDLANKGGVTEEDALYSSDPVPNLQLLVLQLTRTAPLLASGKRLG